MEFKTQNRANKIYEKIVKIPGYIGICFAFLTIYDLLFQISADPFRNISILFFSFGQYTSLIASLLIIFSIVLVYSVTKWSWRRTSTLAASVTGLIFISPSYVFFAEFVTFMLVYFLATGTKYGVESGKADWFLNKIGSNNSDTTNSESEEETIKKIQDKYMDGRISEGELDKEITDVLDNSDRDTEQVNQKLDQKERESTES